MSPFSYKTQYNTSRYPQLWAWTISNIFLLISEKPSLALRCRQFLLEQQLPVGHSVQVPGSVSVWRLSHSHYTDANGTESSYHIGHSPSSWVFCRFANLHGNLSGNWLAICIASKWSSPDHRAPGRLHCVYSVIKYNILVAVIATLWPDSLPITSTCPSWHISQVSRMCFLTSSK